MTPKTVMQHPTLRAMVIMPESMGGYVDTKRKAEAEGYTVVPFVPKPAQSGGASADRSWRSAIMQLPEARNRPSATAEILAGNSSEQMTVESARAFLRGIPTEQPEAKAAPKMSSEPLAARRAELKSNMTAFNRSEGYAPKQRGRQAPSTSAADPVKLKRLAEIRLNALECGDAIDNGTEKKKLRYALDVHSQTGAPLANVFAQLSVDTSKMFAKEA